MHYVFGKLHVSGSSASCSGDISSDDASDEDEDMVLKYVQNVKKIRNTEKENARGHPLVLRRRMRRALSFVCIRALVRR
jgi:hypothetical protein